jgi:hypothetical protein
VTAFAGVLLEGTAERCTPRSGLCTDSGALWLALLVAVPAEQLYHCWATFRNAHVWLTLVTSWAEVGRCTGLVW